MGISFLIYTITDQRIIYISQCNYLCGNRDFFSLQAIRVAFSIVTFMMPSADIMGNPNQRLVFVIFQALQHGSTDGTVCLDNLEFFLGQSAWFIQDLIIYTDLSDIVKQSCLLCNFNVIRLKTYFFCEKNRIIRYMAGMFKGIRILCIDCCSQCVNRWCNLFIMLLYLLILKFIFCMCSINFNTVFSVPFCIKICTFCLTEQLIRSRSRIRIKCNSDTCSHRL